MRVPSSYHYFCQRVRRHRRSDVLVAVASLNAALHRAQFGEPAPRLPNVVQPFSLAGVARAALVSGNERRDVPVGIGDLVDMCAAYGEVVTAGIESAQTNLPLRSILNPIAYEQFGHQLSLMENVGRTLPLLLDHVDSHPKAAGAEQWQDLLGVPLDAFMRIGFAMHAAALSGRGVVHRDTLLADDYRPVFDPLSPEEGLRVIDRWFSASLDHLRTAGLAAEIPGFEKWSVSPLVAAPVVAFDDGRLVVPWVYLVIERMTPTGLYYIGREAFGSRFSDALGKQFEGYVGTQLGLLEHAEVIPEISYSGNLTCDFFVVTPEVVVLVEVKANRPIWATRLGEPSGDEDTAGKINHAYEQIDTTAALLSEHSSALASIPTDRPVRGLVVTLEPFHMVNTPFFDNVLTRPQTPTIVASAHELEGVVADLRDAPDTGARLLSALSPETWKFNLRSAVDDLPTQRNPILDDAWQRFTLPWKSGVESSQM